MAVDPKATTQEPAQPQGNTAPGGAMTFGGMVPNLSETTEVPSLSISEEAPQPQLLTIQGAGGSPILDSETAKKREDKIRFGMKEDAPAPEVIQAHLQDGTESILRQSAASLMDAKDQALQYQQIKEKASVGALDHDLEALVKYTPKNDPNTVFEKSFANSYVSTLYEVKSPEENLAVEANAKDSNHGAMVDDTARALVTKQEIAKTALENQEVIAKNQGWAGWGADFAKGFVPGYSWYKTYNTVEGTPSDSVLQGNNWGDQIEYLYSLPPSDMHNALNNTLEKLSADNPQLAREFASAVVSYTKTDAFIHNVGNVLDVVGTVPGVATGTVAAVKKIAGVATDRIAKNEVKSQLVQAFKDHVSANAAPDSSVPAVMARTGDLEKAALANVTEKAKEILMAKGDISLTRPEIQRLLPSVFNPEALIADGSNLSAKQTIDLISHLTYNASKVLDKINNSVKVGRLPEEALQVGLQESQAVLRDRFKHVSDAVIDMRNEFDNETNTWKTIVSLGDKNGQSFGNKEQAYSYARGVYGLHMEDIKIEQRGVGFYATVTKPLDETTPGVRNALITTENTTPNHLDYYTGFLKSGHNRVSQFQKENRITAVSAQSGLVESLKDMAKDITSLSKNERNSLKRVMEDNRSTVDPITEQPGVFHRTFKEFADNYERINGKPPSAKETRAYFTSVQINDLEYIMRNNSLYKELSRLGLETFFLETKGMKDGLPQFGQTTKFLGKHVDDLPLAQADSKHPATVAIYDQGAEPQIVPLALMNTAERKAYVEELKSKGYKIIQTAIPNRKPAGEVFGEDPINFIITKDFKSHALDRNPLPYRAGWHQEYEHSWYIKQPNIRRVVDKEKGLPTHHVYEGDVTAMAFHTQAEAEKYAKAWNQARQLLKDKKYGELKEFLNKNLPYSVKDFRGLFTGEKPMFNIDDDFFHVSKGSNVVDIHDLGPRYTEFNDTVRSPWNLYDQVDKKFVGQRDPLVHTVLEKGTEENPVFQLATAETIDPFNSLSRAMTNMVRNQYMLDYRTQAVESWIQEFGALIDNAGGQQDLANNALHHIYNPVYKSDNLVNKNDKDRAELARRAIVEFLGNSASNVSGVDTAKQKLLDNIYRTLGQDYSNWVAPKILHAETDLLKIMRGFAFHTTIGLFNPFHMWQNAQTMGVSLAVGGMRGLEGARAGVVFNYLRLNQTDKAIKAMAKASGWKEDEFREAFDLWKKSGRGVIEGEHAWKDDLADPTFFNISSNIPVVGGAIDEAKKWGSSILDKGQIFFREGERVARQTAFATAYREWRHANPGTKLTDDIARKIISRSDDLTLNMTRASAAAWQQGAFSVPTQFLSFQARLTETMMQGLLFNKGSFNRTEAARLVAFNTAMYGVPMGVGTALGGFYNPYEDVREWILKEKGWGVDDKVLTAIHDGVMGLATSMITGRPNDISSRAGPAGSNVIGDILSGDKNAMELLVGVAGTKMWQALTSAKPLLRDLTAAASGNPDDHPFFAEDISDILKNVQSFSMATKMYIALTTGKEMSKNGRYEGRINPLEAAIEFITKGKPWDISDLTILETMMKNKKDAMKEIGKQITKEHQEGLTALTQGDRETYEARQRRIQALMSLDWTLEERAELASKTWDENRSLADRIPAEWAFRQAPPANREKLQQQFFKSTTEPPQ